MGIFVFPEAFGGDSEALHLFSRLFGVECTADGGWQWVVGIGSFGVCLG
jgi:hypothetical protein